MVTSVLGGHADASPCKGAVHRPVQLCSRLVRATTRGCCRASEHLALQDGQPLCGEGRRRLPRRLPPPEGSPGQLSRGWPPQVCRSSALNTSLQHSALQECRNAGTTAQGLFTSLQCMLSASGCHCEGWHESCCSLGAPAQQPSQQQIWCPARCTARMTLWLCPALGSLLTLSSPVLSARVPVHELQALCEGASSGLTWCWGPCLSPLLSTHLPADVLQAAFQG